MPRIGCGLAGGTGDMVEPIIIHSLCKKNVPVFVYDLPAGTESIASSEMEQDAHCKQ
jgi:hypothetical protein